MTMIIIITITISNTISNTITTIITITITITRIDASLRPTAAEVDNAIKSVGSLTTVASRTKELEQNQKFLQEEVSYLFIYYLHIIVIIIIITRLLISLIVY